MKNYKKKQVKETVDKLPGNLAYLSDKKVFSLSFANVNIILLLKYFINIYIQYIFHSKGVRTKTA